MHDTHIEWIEPSEEHPRDAHPAVTAWRAHVDAGRIGRRLPVDPEIAANRARTEALFARPPRIW